MRVDLEEGEVAEGEADPFAELLLDVLDLPIGPSRVWALIVAVLEDQAASRCATDVVDCGTRYEPRRPRSDKQEGK